MSESATTGDKVAAGDDRRKTRARLTDALVTIEHTERAGAKLRALGVLQTVDGVSYVTASDIPRKASNGHEARVKVVDTLMTYTSTRDYVRTRSEAARTCADFPDHDQATDAELDAELEFVLAAFELAGVVPHAGMDVDAIEEAARTFLAAPDNHEHGRFMAYRSDIKDVLHAVWGV